MTRKQGIIALIVAVIVAAGAGAAWYFLSDHEATESASSQSPTDQTAAPAARGPVPEPVVLVLDKTALLRASKAGQDITRQIRALADQAKAELDPQGRALQSEVAALKAQAASLTPEQRQARVTALEQKQQAFQQVAGAKQQRIQMALAAANHEMEKALGPILKQVMADHHGNIVVDKQVVILATDSSFDVTQEVVQKLDAVLPSVKVEMPPADAVAGGAPGGATP